MKRLVEGVCVWKGGGGRPNLAAHVSWTCYMSLQVGVLAWTYTQTCIHQEVHKYSVYIQNSEGREVWVFTWGASEASTQHLSSCQA